MELPSISNQTFDLVVVGGGAAGFMGAISAAEAGVQSVLVLEATGKPLEKVRISGGGRCNVINACWDPSDLVMNYPRGHLEMRGPFSRFAAGDALGWFTDRGLDLVVEEDGRIFPKSNKSSSVISCLRNEAKLAGVSLFTKVFVEDLKALSNGMISIECRKKTTIISRKVLIATGGHPSGRRIASDLGHNIIYGVPSLFSFALEHNYLQHCPGISVDNVNLNLLVDENKYCEIGRILITHKGLSGPGILRLSAFAARDLFYAKYKAELSVNWLGENINDAKKIIQSFRNQNKKSGLLKVRPFANIPKRLWRSLLINSGIDHTIKWCDLSSKNELNLLKKLVSSKFIIKGRGPFGEEFVTAGGVDLSEVNLLSMESRIVPGVYFAGEILNVDGITGGYNFQHCWTSGWLAGNAIGKTF